MARRASSSSPAANAAPHGAGVPGRSVAYLLFRSLRPEQWTKNLIVFAGLIFGLELGNAGSIVRAAAAFAVFCALSGVVYVVNDIMDREADRRHPLKARRPIASGALSPVLAGTVAAALAVGALAVAFWLGWRFGAVALAYLLLQSFYSGPLKHIVILDVLTIAIGFVLRAAAGAVVIDVPISHWLLIVTVLLALFLALSKRRHELVMLADGALEHRPILGEYSPYLLDQMISVVTASTLVAYIFYCISPETVQKFNTDLLGLTIPFPLYGIFRYLYLVHRREGGGSPSQMLLNDRLLLTCVALWVLAVVVIVYLRPFGV
ncbi:MAG: decaprenyl-phosphate phosphoribosyltransferase [Acidobacteria bacterium]|nr:decaprenyl-phosphate phosphoribosyltransferase [Acidobacteriota bacterium]